VVPSHVGSAGWTNKNAGAERRNYGDEFGHFILLYLRILKITNR
jgi:hypothetical protein